MGPIKKTAPKGNENDLDADTTTTTTGKAEGKAKAKTEAKAPTGKDEAPTEAERIEAAQREEPQTEESANDYLPKEKEMHLFHARLERVKFSQVDGKRLSKPTVQMFKAADWAQHLNNNNILGYTNTLLWDPTKYFI